jgi:DNA adenine methylase
VQKDKFIVPFLKWAGGKRQLLPAIANHIPNGYITYYEPFVGGGAVLFYLQPSLAVINDYNSELINVYKVIKNHPDELIEDLKKHRNESEYFYRIRALDRSNQFEKLTEVEKASRVIFLNKTCYNGLFRVNNSGEFNAPFGRYKNPNIVNEHIIRGVSSFLKGNDIQILNKDYTSALEGVTKNDFVYFDPPYHPLSESSSFTGYLQGGFNKAEQERLKETCDELNKKGIRFLLSNSATDFIKKLYSKYTIIYVKANRYVNSVAKKRGAIDEVLVKNYD